MSTQEILNKHGVYTNELELDLLRYWDQIHRFDYGKSWIDSAIPFIKQIADSEQWKAENKHPSFADSANVLYQLIEVLEAERKAI